jgi:hypothetical protein
VYEALPSLFPRFAPNTHIYLYASTVHMYCYWSVINRTYKCKTGHIGGYCFQMHTQNYFKYFYHRPVNFYLRFRIYIRQAILVGKCCHCRIKHVIAPEANNTPQIMLLLHMQIRRYFNKIYDNYLLLRDDFQHDSQ